VKDLDGLPDFLTDEISHFFEVYKALEPDKYSSVRGWEGSEAAWQEIEDCLQRYRDTHAG
jgi:inorganic pyrophosphatase